MATLAQSLRLQRKIEPIDDHRKLDELQSLMRECYFANEQGVDPWAGHIDQRLDFHIRVAVACNVPLFLHLGAPAVCLKLQPGVREPSTIPGDWTGLGDYTRNVQDVLDQLLDPARGELPAGWRMQQIEPDGLYRAQIEDEAMPVDLEPIPDTVRPVNPAMALLPEVLGWHLLLLAGDLRRPPRRDRGWRIP